LIRKDLLNNDMVGNESINHYAGVCELAGFLIQNGYPTEINHYDGVDISSNINGSKMAIFDYPPEKVKQDKIFENVGYF
jgi:hypothetical protein